MATLTYFGGRPDYDWQGRLQDILEGGWFTPVGVSGNSLTLALGGHSLVLHGVGLQASGNRQISAGTVTGFSLVHNGQTQLSMTGLTTPDFLDVRAMLNGAAGLDPYGTPFRNLIGPLFTAEAVNATDSVGGDTIYGSAFADSVAAGSGADVFGLGAGIDHISYADLYSEEAIVNSVRLNLSDSAIDLSYFGISTPLAAQSAVDPYQFTDTVIGVENATGTWVSDILAGSSANNVLMGLEGLDVFVASAGHDVYYGGNDNDYIYFATFTAGVTIDLNVTTAQAVAGGSVRLDSVESAAGGHGNDVIYGTAERNVLSGGAGGNDTLHGFGGHDLFRIGGGTDIFHGGSGSDTLLAPRSFASLNIDLSLSTAQALPWGSITISGMENIDGGSGNETFKGNSSNNELYGWDGNDVFIATTGHDLYFGEDDDDTLSFAGWQSAVDISLNQYGPQAVNGGTILVSLVENLIGGNGHDTLGGGIYGGVLTGGKGNDTVVGVSSSDTGKFSGISGAYSIRQNLDGTVRVTDSVTNRDGLDTLIGAETLRFTDHDVYVDDLPIVAGYSFGAKQAGTNQFGQNTGWTNQDAVPRHLADVNGDGFDDIVGFGNNGVLVSLGNGNGGFGPLALVLKQFGLNNGGWASDNSNPRQLADVNGDGRADIVGFGNAGVFVSLANGDGGFRPITTALSQFGKNAGWTSQTATPRQVADVNGDGRADIVGFGNGKVFVALGLENGTFATSHAATSDFGTQQGWASQSATPRLLGDVNGDGRADIVGFHNSQVFVALGTSFGTFGAKFVAGTDFTVADGWANNNTHPRQLRDVNGDGRADIIGFDAAGVHVALANSNGTFGAQTLSKAEFGANQAGAPKATIRA